MQTQQMILLHIKDGITANQVADDLKISETSARNALTSLFKGGGS